MNELVFASNNVGKIRELGEMIQDIKLLSLHDISFADEIPEPYHTFEENAHIKASTIHNHCGKNVFADDSGICLNALGGSPGVHSAYYAGLPRNEEKNLQKVLDELQNKQDRTAYYKAVICLIWQGETHYFSGTCHGHIIEARKGSGGFGYDPIFVPDGYTQTFAELPPEVKNSLSHRGMAVKKMIDFLKEHNT
jgi:XTP/dITP diphosphohydrolase